MTINNLVRNESMKNIFIFSILIFVFVASRASFAKQNDEITRLCIENTNIQDKLCNCIGKKSIALTEQERSMVIALMIKDQVMADALRPNMPGHSVLTSGMFFVNASKNCANEM